jgi:hypothetical protein
MMERLFMKKRSTEREWFCNDYIFVMLSEDSPVSKLTGCELGDKGAIPSVSNNFYLRILIQTGLPTVPPMQDVSRLF